MENNKPKNYPKPKSHEALMRERSREQFEREIEHLPPYWQKVLRNARSRDGILQESWQTARKYAGHQNPD